jgi:hypothetical protein
VALDAASQASTVIDNSSASMAQTTPNPINGSGAQVAGPAATAEACLSCQGNGIRPMYTDPGGETPRQYTDSLLFYWPLDSFISERNWRWTHHDHTLNWSSDGCSNPFSSVMNKDTPLGHHFLHPCQRHDFGYRNYKAQSRFNHDNRYKIDGNFLNDMYTMCHRESLIDRPGCRLVANTYYSVVRMFGGRPHWM